MVCGVVDGYLLFLHEGKEGCLTDIGEASGPIEPLCWTWCGACEQALCCPVVFGSMGESANGPDVRWYARWLLRVASLGAGGGAHNVPSLVLL